MRVGTDDPMMNFEAGGRKYPTRNGVADIPDHLASQFDQGSDAPFGVLRGPVLGVGWGAGTCDNALKQALRREAR